MTSGNWKSTVILAVRPNGSRMIHCPLVILSYHACVVSSTGSLKYLRTLSVSVGSRKAKIVPKAVESSSVSTSEIDCVINPKKLF